MDISFHCDSKSNFDKKHTQVRAFLYKDYSIEPHNHDFYELNIVLGGTGTHQIENKRINVKAGDVFMIPPMTIHAYYNTDKLDVYHILLHKSFVLKKQKDSAGISGYLQLVEIEPFLRQHFSEEIFLHLSQGQLVQLKYDLQIIEDGGMFDLEEMTLLKNHTVWKIIYWLSALLFEQAEKGEKKSLNKYELEIIKILEYIHQSYDEKITVDLLCRKSFMSRSTFIRNFCKICGCTPMEYVNRYRCTKALQMMENAEFSKTKIAHLCGFYDLSHMERTIKQLL